MTILAFLVIWLGSSTLNIVIFNWGKTRLAKAFHGGAPSPMDVGDVVLLILLAPLGPIGVLIGIVMTEWWCSGFEDRPKPQTPGLDKPVERQSRARTLALRRAGWSDQEIADSEDRK